MPCTTQACFSTFYLCTIVPTVVKKFKFYLCKGGKIMHPHCYATCTAMHNFKVPLTVQTNTLVDPLAL